MFNFYKTQVVEIDYATIFQRLEYGFIILDEKGKILTANNAFCNLLSYQKENIVNDNIINYIDAYKNIQSSLKKSKTNTYKNTLIKSDGKIVHVMWYNTVDSNSTYCIVVPELDSEDTISIEKKVSKIRLFFQRIYKIIRCLVIGF